MIKEHYNYTIAKINLKIIVIERLLDKIKVHGDIYIYQLIILRRYTLQFVTQVSTDVVSSDQICLIEKFTGNFF